MSVGKLAFGILLSLSLGDSARVANAQTTSDPMPAVRASDLPGDLSIIG
jgi:hypothetical protein